MTLFFGKTIPVRTTFYRKYRKYRKFFDKLVFFNEDAERKPKCLPFHFEEKDILIDFFKNNSSLWKHNIIEYHDHTLIEALYDKLIEIYDGKFTKDDVKEE